MHTIARLIKRLSTAALLFVAMATNAHAVTVWTHSYDNSRTGANTSETVLNDTNVNVNTFGKLFTCPVDGQLYAEPLYIPNVTINGNVHNVVYCCSMENSVYAFDADNGAQLWHTNYGTPLPANNVQCCCPDIVGDIGILSTPVIDTSTNTMYVVHRNLIDGVYTQWLHAVDITSGAEKFGGPVQITATYGGVSLDPKLNNQRAALTLANGTVYITWSSHNDCGDYHGFIVGYQASNITNQQYVWVDTTGSGNLGGVWMAGQGLDVDSSGDLYLTTGNGYYDGTSNFAETILKMPPTLAPGPLDWFTPTNQASMGDGDLGSAGDLLMPGTNDLVGGGKDGRLWLINTTTGDMGEFSASGNNVLQVFQAVSGELLNTPVYWNSPEGPQIYDWGTGDECQTWNFNGTTFNTTPTSTTTFTAGDAPIALSANGSTAGTGILWGEEGTTLHALDAENLGDEIWNSSMNSGRDSLGNYAKWAPPTVANGKVYASTFSGYLAVYGLLADAGPSPVSATAGDGLVTLNWGSATNALSYNVYRSTASGGEGASPYVSGITNTSYTDTSVTNGTTYYYTVATVSSAGSGSTTTSAQSAQVSALPYNPTLTSIVVTPGPSLILGPPLPQSQQFTATALDQYGNPLAPQPTFVWTLGAGSVGSIGTSTGLYHSGKVVGTATVEAKVGSVSSACTVTVTTIPAVTGFNAADWTFNDDNEPGPAISNNVLQITTDGAYNEGNTAFFNTPQNDTVFTASFIYQMVYSAAADSSLSPADGTTFTLQNDPRGLNAIGAIGGQLAYSSITNSIAVALNVYASNTPGTAFWTDGQVNLPESATGPVNLASGDPISVVLSYSDGTLTETLTDQTTLATYTTSYAVNVPAVIGGDSAIMGFTGGTGGGTCSQYISDFRFTNNGLPAVVNPAAAHPNPVTGSTAALSVLGGDDGGESTLTYTWSSGYDPAGVTFSANGTNAAKNTTATFTQAGSYPLTVTITDPSDDSITSSMNLSVNQTPTTIAVTPGPTVVMLPPLPQTQQFAATVFDQFGTALSPQPAIGWSLASGSVGSIGASSGLYHSGKVNGSSTVKAKAGSASTTVTVEVNPPPTVATPASASPNPVTGQATGLSVLGAYVGTGGAGALTYNWSAAGPAAVTYSDNGDNTAQNTTATFTQAGSYTFTATITSPTGTSTTSSVTVTVNQTLTSITVSPGPTLTLGPPLPQTQQFTATALDQFGAALATQPAFAWSLASGGVGSITVSGGLYHSGTVAGSATVKAKSGTMMGTSVVTVN